MAIEGPRERRRRHQDLEEDPEPPPPAGAENHDFDMVWTRWSRRLQSVEDQRGWERRGRGVVRCGVGGAGALLK